MSMIHAKNLFLALWLLFPLGQLTRLPLKIPGVNVYCHDLVIISLLVVWLWKCKKEGKLPRLFSLGKPALLFVFTMIFSWGFNFFKWGWQRSLLGSLYWLRWLFYFGIYLAVANLTSEFKTFKVFLLRLLILSGIAAVFLGFVQYFFYPDFRFGIYSGWDPHLYRIVGTYLDPGFTGMIYLLVLLLISDYFYQRATWLKLLVYCALALTYARSAYLSFLAATATVALKKRVPRVFVMSLFLVLLTIILLPRRASVGTRLERKDSAWARIVSWQKAIKIFSHSPLIGVGFNNYRWAQRASWESHAGAGSDSSLFFLLATTGVLGTSVYLYFLWSILKSSTLITFVTTIALLTHSFFNNSLFYPWIMIWWWTILGLNTKNITDDR